MDIDPHFNPTDLKKILKEIFFVTNELVTAVNRLTLLVDHCEESAAKILSRFDGALLRTALDEEVTKAEILAMEREARKRRPPERKRECPN